MANSRRAWPWPSGGNAPFSTWISPNNFGDFHSNPLMSLLTGSGQIEYPLVPWPVVRRETIRTVSRIGAAIPIISLVANLGVCNAGR
ncbi:hypothetical protein WN51_10257 [Melipona quadrifasciata]|uniref:Uncharacterized protein n=1 Tax=Melipona quadrifasciata TaxID=166423 RepID=A0A0M9A4P3_9HYME|nr:hypothetical protein WN51_10257 [Melipona quadrifasciata]